MMIFPLSWPGKIVLILIAIVLGIICWAMYKPEKFRAFTEKLKQKKTSTSPTDKDKTKTK